jgi:hypothetical protein
MREPVRARGAAIAIAHADSPGETGVRACALHGADRFAVCVVVSEPRTHARALREKRV